jgi:hypothetical protein
MKGGKPDEVLFYQNEGSEGVKPGIYVPEIFWNMDIPKYNYTDDFLVHHYYFGYCPCLECF